MIEELKTLKDTYESARSQIDKSKEPLQDLLILDGFLAALVADPSLLRDKVDKDYKRYFLEDFSQGMLKRLTKEKSKNNQYLEVIGKILERFLLIFIQQLKEGTLNYSFFDSVRLIFDFDTLLHQLHYQVPQDQLKKIKIDNNTQEWRKELQVGDMVDAIQDEIFKCPGWSQAKISQIDGETLHLQFIYDTKNTDRYLDRWSVDIAKFESKTKELFDWKNTLKVKQLIDAHDKTSWIKSTILEVKDLTVSPDRVIKQALVAFRIYVEKSAKSDDIGPFEGWSNKFDEWVSLFSPRIQQFYTKTQKGGYEDSEIDEDLDCMFTPEEGHKSVFAVPRLRKCTSSLFIHLINEFGTQGGFEEILHVMEKSEGGEEIDLNIVAILLECVSKPYLIYHRDFQKEYVPKIVSLVKAKLQNIPDLILRNVKRERLEGVVKGIDQLQRRTVSKDQRHEDTENLKLQLCLMCLRSSYRDKTIQGLKDLNSIIKANRFTNSKVFTNEFLIDWMYKNDIFTMLFDPKKTHPQIVQRCSDILRLLLQENKLTLELTQKFWGLSKFDYKPEVYKIVTDGASLLKQEHIDYIFDQIKQLPSEKLSMEEFQVLSEFGKVAKEDSFKQLVGDFFWKVICHSELYKEELVSNCITKFCEMVLQWDLSKKYEYLVLLVKNLEKKESSIPSLRLFRGLIKDHKDISDKEQQSASKNTENSQNVGSYPPRPQSNESEIVEEQKVEDGPTISDYIEKLLQEHKLVEVLLSNFTDYFKKALENLHKNPSLHQLDNRKKLYLVDPKYSHHDEIEERLQSLKYIASISPTFSISKKELGAIYELLVRTSAVPSDYEEFLIWCKLSCEQSSPSVQILDLNEVGEFFIQKMSSKELDLRNLLEVGFEFLQHYFLSVNEKSQKLIKSLKKKENKEKQQLMIGFYPMPKAYYDNQAKKGTVPEEEEKGPIFKLLRLPKEMEQLDIVWKIALECQNEKVVPRAISFLIKVYTQLDEELKEEKTQVQDEIISKCMEILALHCKDQETSFRVLLIIKSIIHEAERKGTGGVQPHNAVLKGELLEKVLIKNRASTKKGNLVMSVYSNTTVWEFRQEVALQLDLAPRYLKLEMQNGTVIKDLDNGKTLAQLGFQSGETVCAYKVHIDEEIVIAPLIGPDNKLTPKLKDIFDEWFDMYSDEQGAMTKETCTMFIKGCTGEMPSVNDDRVLNLFKQYDSNQDGRIEREEFIGFYENASRNKGETVRENLKMHNIRGDLKKLSEILEESSFKREDMPRYKISRNQQYFDLLISLLDRHDETSSSSWDLIQMLATNQVLYRRVLELQTAKGQNEQVDWSKFFDTQSVYKLLYTLQIVEAVMEDGDSSERILVIEEEDPSKRIPVPPPLPQGFMGPFAPGMGPVLEMMGLPDGPEQEELQEGQNLLDQEEQKNKKKDLQLAKKVKRSTSIVEDDEVDRQLRSEWTKMFLQHHGFEYILEVFLSKSISTQELKRTTSGLDKAFNDAFELKHIAFLLKLLKIFIMAAFSTKAQKSSNAEISQESPSQQHEDISKFKELQALVEGERASIIIGAIDFQKMNHKILSTISQVLNKQSLMFEDKLIIENSLKLWVGCLSHKKELIKELYNFSGEKNIQTGEDLILNGLLYNSQEKIREDFKQALEQVARITLEGEQEESPLEYLLTILSKHFSEISQYQCKHYFELFCELIDLHFSVINSQKEGSSSKSSFNPQTILVLLINKVKEYNQASRESSEKEKEISKEKEDDIENIYIGLINLMGKIIDNFDIKYSEKIVEDNNLIDEIFARFLFQSVFRESQQSAEVSTIKVKAMQIKRQLGDDNSNKFGKKSKDAAYKLVNSLIKKSPVLMNSFLEKSMLPLMNLIRRIDGWNHTPSGSSEKSQKYVGLKNLGCICYMNSMLQQFFMVPSFRYNLLTVDDGQPEQLEEYKGSQIDDNVLHQFQKLIAHLELSERQDYNPYEFCFAFKDLEGNPTNLGEQKDAQEFLSMLFAIIEGQLSGTSKKYLLQSVFGGQTCSQMVCQECGNVRNRIEDFYNLSLPIKEIKSMEQSLAKMIEGEVINDYHCEQCNKKVDISKRTLISQTPNVLIVHLQRIGFNFDTYRLDKDNSYWEFPYQLDLKPYSFYEVMKKENRIGKKQGDDEGEGEQKPETTNEDNQWPSEEDCYEYKLVGVNVHSGTANAGHYWSYINPLRGFLEPDAATNPNWDKTESEPWLEFNDSIVKDFSFDKLKDDCFGGDKKSQTGGSDMGGWGFGDSAYGKSAYMLVYERKKKRPIKILLKGEELEEAKRAERQIGQESSTIQYDEKREEHYRLIDYRDGVEEIRPNKIYKQVFEDNMKFEFENDIYSQEFFDFVNGIVKAVTNLAAENPSKENSDLMKLCTTNVMKIGKKAIFEIVAKCFYNKCITGMTDTLIDLFKLDTSLPALFLEQCYQEDQFDYLFTLLLECSDAQARIAASTFLKYILSTLKLQEKDILYKKILVKHTNQKDETQEIEEYEALSSRFFMKCLSILNTKAAKNWLKLDNFFEVIQAFIMGDVTFKKEEASPEAIKIHEEGIKIGVEFCFSIHFIEKVCDFILGKKSPLLQIGEKRHEMGGSYTNPNFSVLIQIITKLITDDSGIIKKYPLTKAENKMLLQNDLLKVMLGSSTGSKQFGVCLAKMCFDNYKLSKKVAKVFLQAINNSNYESVRNYLKALKPFIKMEDSLKMQRLEWIFGYSQVMTRKGYREERFKYGIETINNIQDESTEYTSPFATGPVADPLLGQLFKCKGRLDTFIVNSLKELLSLMKKDELIARYIYYQAPPTYQMARYIDWIKSYLENQKSETEKTKGYSYIKQKNETIVKSLQLYDVVLETRFKVFLEEQQKKMEQTLSEGAFSNLDRNEDWFAWENPDVINHFPPEIVVGKQVGEEEKEFYVNDENAFVKIIIHEIVNEYNYSNPTCFFNISIPHIDLRTNNYQGLSYTQFKKMQKKIEQQIDKQESEKQDESKDSDDEETTPVPEETTPETPTSTTTNESQSLEQEEDINVKVSNWSERAKTGSILLRVTAINKLKQKAKVIVSFETTPQQANARIPISFFKYELGENETNVLGHIIKIDPSKPWGDLKVKVQIQEKNLIPDPPNAPTRGAIFIGSPTALGCGSCNFKNDMGSSHCFQCGNLLMPDGVGVGTQDDSEMKSFFDVNL